MDNISKLRLGSGSEQHLFLLRHFQVCSSFARPPASTHNLPPIGHASDSSAARLAGGRALSSADDTGMKSSPCFCGLRYCCCCCYLREN